MYFYTARSRPQASCGERRAERHAGAAKNKALAGARCKPKVVLADWRSRFLGDAVLSTVGAEFGGGY
jgi:hypothetical protein